MEPRLDAVEIGSLYAGNDLDKARRMFEQTVRAGPRIRLTIRRRTRVVAAETKTEAEAAPVTLTPAPGSATTPQVLQCGEAVSPHPQQAPGVFASRLGILASGWG